jgi:hypothetical protein
MKAAGLAHIEHIDERVTADCDSVCRNSLDIQSGIGVSPDGSYRLATGTGFDIPITPGEQV